MKRRLSNKPVARATTDFLTGLGIFALVLAAITADAATAWSLQPAQPTVATTKAAAATAKAGIVAHVSTSTAAKSTATKALVSPVNSNKTRSPNVVAAVPYRGPSFTAGLMPTDRQIAILLLAMMFSLISAVVLRSTRHLRRVIAKPVRSQWSQR